MGVFFVEFSPEALQQPTAPSGASSLNGHTHTNRTDVAGFGGVLMV